MVFVGTFLKPMMTMLLQKICYFLLFVSWWVFLLGLVGVVGVFGCVWCQGVGGRL